MPTAAAKPDQQEWPDSELARRTAAGEREAFEQLMRRYNRSLYRTARSIVKDDSEAEDVLQESYLLAYRRMHQFRGEASLTTWLTRIVVNEAIARSRKAMRRAEVIRLNGDLSLSHEAAEDIMDDNMDALPERAAMRAEARRIMEKKIDELPEAFRTVFMLRAIEEMSVEEVAACLDIPEATVRSRFFRARGQLREALSREFDFALDEAFSFDGARCDRIVASVLLRL